MESVKLDFTSIDIMQSYKNMEFTKTDKGNIVQSIDNLVVALMNLDYCKTVKALNGHLFWDSFSNEIKF